MVEDMNSPQQEPRGRSNLSIIKINNRSCKENFNWVPFDEETGEGAYFDIKVPEDYSLIAFVDSTKKTVLYNKSKDSFPLIIHISQD